MNNNSPPAETSGEIEGDSIKIDLEAPSIDAEKKKYGVLLPRSGVYFLPDERIVTKLKEINQLKRQREREEDYIKANELQEIFDQYSKDEYDR